MKKFYDRKGQRGFSLIELTIAVAIFATGLGSFSLLLLMAVQGTAESRIQMVAVSQARSLAEAVRMVPDAGGHFLSSTDTASCPAGSVCVPARMAAATLNDWNHQLAALIPGANGLVCRDASPGDGSVIDAACDGGGGLVVKVFWTEPGGNGEPFRDRRVFVRIPPP